MKPRGNDPPPSQPDPPPQPADADAQRKADAEQRARMQKALENKQENGERADDRTPQAGEQAATQSAASRETQRANEAWLRPVPDDPGGLLRAKFRLDSERRRQTGSSRCHAGTRRWPVSAFSLSVSPRRRSCAPGSIKPTPAR